MSTATAPAAPAASTTLDEVMLAMDVVDTLRHDENLVLRELDEGRREAELIEKLRGIYRNQGIAVSDAVLKQGVAALRESRFVYTPPPPGLGTRLARLWVARHRYGKALLAGAIALAVLVGGWWMLIEGPRRAEAARIQRLIGQELPAALSQRHRSALEAARDAAGRERADQLLAAGQAALARRDVAGGEQAVANLDALLAQLNASYRLIVYSRPGQVSGVWRLPPRQAADQRRNYYLIVEAIGPEGTPLILPITNEEDGRVEQVSRWGQRVPETVFAAVARDKQDDGVIQNNLVGEKRRGELAVSFRMPAVPGGTITRW